MANAKEKYSSYNKLNVNREIISCRSLRFLVKASKQRRTFFV